MIIIDSLFEKENSEGKVIALGNFDGFHIGHMKLIEKCIALSKKENYKSAVLSFKNNPSHLFKNGDCNSKKVLIENEEKIKLLCDKIDYFLLVDFDEKILHIGAEDFLYILRDSFNIKAIITGFNFRFGYENLGDNLLIEKFCKANDMKFYVVPPVKYDDKIVSSTYIREALCNEGNIKLVNTLLGRRFCINGKVMSGKRLGRTLGFPTANLDFDKSLAVPSNGVYYTEVLLDNRLYKAITSIGYNPTISQNNDIKIETYIFDFNNNIYEKDIKILFLDRIRNEIKFDNIYDLKKQIESDINYIHKTFYN